MKKSSFLRFYHHDAHYYVIISHNSSVPMIGHLELAIGTLTSYVSRAWLNKNLAVSRHEVRFFSYASEQIWIWLWMNLSRSDWLDFWLRMQPMYVGWWDAVPPGVTILWHFISQIIIITVIAVRIQWILACPVRMLRIRMTGDWKSREQLANTGWPAKQVYMWPIYLLYSCKQILCLPYVNCIWLVT